MAKPIKDTPVLEGTQASQFLTDVKANEGKKVSLSDLDKMKQDHAKISRLMVKK
jgi:hypothetical protein